MSSFQIFSDGACDMPADMAKKNNITIIPFYVSLDHETYKKELEELSLDEFYTALAKPNCFPKTSLPSVQDYIDAFTPALEEGKDIISFHITTTLSGSCQSAATAQQILQESYPQAKIYVVNSFLATGAQSLMALEAARMQQAGKTIDEVYAYTQKAKRDGRIIFIIGGLNHLQKGGRIGKVASLSGTLLNIKPLIILKDGEINVGGVARGRKKGLQKLVDMTKDHFAKAKENPSDYVCMIGASDDWSEAEPQTDALVAALPSLTIYPPFQIGATITAHTGPGTLGICFIKKFDAYKSL